MINGQLSETCGNRTLPVAAPIVSSVQIRDLAGNPHPQYWSALIDTGADTTVVPLAACKELGLAPRDWRYARGYDHGAQPRRTPRYYVRVEIPEVGDFPLLAFGVQRSYLLLGRDFLAGLLLLVDGESSHWKLGRRSLWTRLVLPFLALR